MKQISDDEYDNDDDDDDNNNNDNNNNLTNKIEYQLVAQRFTC